MRVYFTEEELDYLKANSAYKTLGQLTQGINKLSGRKRTEKSVRMKLWRLGLTYRHKSDKLADTGNIRNHEGNEGLYQVTSWLKARGRLEIAAWLAKENQRIPNTLIMQNDKGRQALFREQKRA